MGTVTVRSFNEPDQTVPLGTGVAQVVAIGSTMLGRMTMQPGWQWSKDVKPIQGTEQCMMLHRGICLSGTLGVKAQDGTEATIHAGDAYVIEPEHDGWVIGDEPWVAVDFSDQLPGLPTG
jgi:hypothetical protein